MLSNIQIFLASMKNSFKCLEYLPEVLTFWTVSDHLFYYNFLIEVYKDVYTIFYIKKYITIFVRFSGLFIETSDSSKENYNLTENDISRSLGYIF